MTFLSEIAPNILNIHDDHVTLYDSQQTAPLFFIFIDVSIDICFDER